MVHVVTGFFVSDLTHLVNLFKSGGHLAVFCTNLDLQSVELSPQGSFRVLNFLNLVVCVDTGLDQELSNLVIDGRLNVLHSGPCLKQLFVVFDLPEGVRLHFLQFCVELVQSFLGLAGDFVDLALELSESRVHFGVEHLFQALDARFELISRQTRVDSLLVTLELHFGGVLELFDLDLTTGDHINRFHETLHAFPHIRHRHSLLVLQLRSQ